MFIALEGIGGSGKGTLKEKITALLDEHQIPNVITREPGGTPIAEQLRTLVREGFNIGGEQLFAQPMATALLFNAARSEHVEMTIKPSLEEGKVVICDRFCDSTFTYQSVFMGIPMEKLAILHKLVIGVYPDMTFLLDCPAYIAVKRVTDWEKSKDQFDRVTLDKQEEMRQRYLDLAKANPDRYTVIDASGDPESVYSQVLPVLTALLCKRNIEMMVGTRSNPYRVSVQELRLKHEIFCSSQGHPAVIQDVDKLHGFINEKIGKEIEDISAKVWNDLIITHENREAAEEAFKTSANDLLPASRKKLINFKIIAERVSPDSVEIGLIDPGISGKDKDDK